MRVTASRAEKVLSASPTRVGKVVSNHNPCTATCSREDNPICMVNSGLDAILIENIIINQRLVTIATPHNDASPIGLVGKRVIGNEPILRECELRPRMGAGFITDRSIQLDTCGQVIIKEIACDLDRRAVDINPVMTPAIITYSRTSREVAVVIELVPIDPNPGSIPQNPHVIMVNPISPNREIMAVVYLDTLVPIPQFKPLNRDPADRLLITSAVLDLNPMKFLLVDKVNNRVLARNVEELDGSRRGAGFPKCDKPFIVCPAPDIGRIPGDHFGRCIGHGSPRLGARAWIAIVPSRGDIVRRCVGRRVWQEGGE